MRTVEEKIYKLEELDKKIQDKAYYKWLEGWEYSWGSENEATLKEFIEIFPIKCRDWSYGGGGYHARSEFQDNVFDEYEGQKDMWEMSGWRLATYIWNNYGQYIYKGKYYSKWSNNHPDGTPLTADNPWKGSGNGLTRLVRRHSKILIEADNCPLTGYGADHAILQPLLEFLKNPLRFVTFKELMQDCLDSWVKYCHEDYEDSSSKERFEEEASENEWEFYEDGSTY